MMDSRKNQQPTPIHQQPPLTRIVPWSQQLACEVLHHGDRAVDLTAGKGRDTLALARAVGPAGLVVAFDLQAEALDQTQTFLEQHGCLVTRCNAKQVVDSASGVFLVESCHSHLQEVVQKPVKAVMANLGYLPGGDQSVITKPESTLTALRQALGLLQISGRLAVTVYPAHPGGAEEASAVDEFFSSLSREQWQVLSLRAANRSEAPYLLVAEKTNL